MPSSSYASGFASPNHSMKSSYASSSSIGGGNGNVCNNGSWHRVLCRDFPKVGGSYSSNFNSFPNIRYNNNSGGGVFVFGSKGAVGNGQVVSSHKRGLRNSNVRPSSLRDFSDYEDEYASSSRMSSTRQNSTSSDSSERFIDDVERSHKTRSQLMHKARTSRNLSFGSQQKNESEFATEFRFSSTKTAPHDRAEQGVKPSLLHSRRQQNSSGSYGSETSSSSSFTSCSSHSGVPPAHSLYSSSKRMQQKPPRESSVKNRVARWRYNTAQEDQKSRFDDNSSSSSSSEDEDGEEKDANNYDTKLYLPIGRRSSSSRSLITSSLPHKSTKSAPKGIPGDSCDKCDCKTHVTDACPYFQKSREKHADAQRRKPMNMCGGDGKIVYVNDARVITMPGDGSCLFHSLSYGLGTCDARKLRRDIAAFIAKNPLLEIAETPLQDWIKYDSNSSVAAYARRMAMGSWGGGIECAACSRLKRVNVHVYEKTHDSMLKRGAVKQYKRISCFDLPGPESKTVTTINVIYCGGVHYNALEIRR